MLQLDGALKEMERNGETQNRRSGSRVGMCDCWGRSSVKGSVKRIYSRQHSSKMTNTPTPTRTAGLGELSTVTFRYVPPDARVRQSPKRLPKQTLMAGIP